jgi:hypothetical protein
MSEMDAIKVESLYLTGRHICDALAYSNPLIVTIDEKDRLILVSQSQIQGSVVLWIKIEYCPFCGAKL